MTEKPATQNTYLSEVLEQQAKVDRELKRHWTAPSSVRPASAPAQAPIPRSGGGAEPPARAIDYRITGFWRWRTVVVPPNVYVVHTRRGQAEPLHMGLGISFPYNPATDAFLVIPAAVQTLLINAKCISAVRQGVLVQAYVQWVVDDLR